LGEELGINQAEDADSMEENEGIGYGERVIGQGFAASSMGLDAYYVGG